MKVVLDAIPSGYNLSKINGNFGKIETALNAKVLYRDNPIGEPNQMGSDLDMNGKIIYNLPEPTLGHQAARLQDVQNAISGVSTANLVAYTPTGSIIANTVQGAINELDVEKVSIVDLANTSDPSKGASLVGFQQAGTGAVARTSEEKMRDRVHVKDFGAATSATAAENLVAIQNALNAGKHIDFGSAADSYSINGTLTLASGHMLNLCGATITQTVDQTPIFDASGTDNVTIKGGRFVGKSEATYVNSPSSQAICIKADSATDLSVTDNRFENFYYSPLMLNLAGNRIEFSRNSVSGPSAVLGLDINNRNCTGATIIGANIRIHGNDIYGTASGLIIGQGSSNISITGNIIHDLVNEHGIYADTGLKGLTITGNTIRYTGSAGVGIKVQHYDAYGIQPENIVISGNSISYTGSDGILVINTAGTSLYATGVSITGNTVYQAGQHGIDVRYARGCTISGNSIEQSVQSAIYVSKCTALNVIGNAVRITGSHAVFDDGTSGDVTYANNVIIEPGTSAASNHSGLLIQGCNEHTIQGNVVRGTLAKTAYGLFINGGTLTTTEVRGNSFTGAAQLGARFPVAAGQLRYQGENKLSGAAAEDNAQSIPETLVRGTRENVYYGTAAPTSGNWGQGTTIFDRYPAAGGHMGWVCVVGGAPGTWRTFGPVTL